MGNPEIWTTTDHEERLLTAGEIVGESIRAVFVHPVTFSLVWRPFQLEVQSDGGFESFWGLDWMTDAQRLEQSRQCQTWAWDTVLFAHTTLRIQSEQVGNKDARGGGCGNLEIPASEFVWSRSCPGGVNLRHLTEAAYRMKGSKYDWWFEYFSGLSLANDPQTTTTMLSVRAWFDYGS
ncbi:MAG: hypothetical protein AAFV53_26960 [Myxococcota bacterium]